MLTLGKHIFSKATKYLFPDQRIEDRKRLEELLSRFRKEDENNVEVFVEQQRSKPLPKPEDVTFIRKIGEYNIRKFSICINYILISSLIC